MQATFKNRLRHLVSCEISSYLSNDNTAMNVARIARELGISTSGLYSYIKGERVPGADALCSIADRYNVSTDWLLGRTDDRTFHG